MQEQLKFKVSAALKSIIGKDLITDDYVAVFELVKNSFDAHATKVTIEFTELGNPQEAKITVTDNGKGMNYEDINNKWLFVAYSAKQEGTEDSGDYRNQIYANRPFAGAKGIGRFSCDRLGKFLLLETKKQNSKRKEILYTDWEKFEGSLKDEFIDIHVLHESEESTSQPSHGTRLEISHLRSSWDRKKLLKLKDSLAKLINPNAFGESFEIEIKVPEEKTNDAKETDPINKVNGLVKNFIFDELGLKTTKIQSNISEDGEVISTALFDGGTMIYNLQTKSNFHYSEDNERQKLKGIRITLYYLNRSAKNTFARRMGLASRLYGHVFLYRHGFRIYPYGEPNEDPLKLEVRKSRKTNSLIGTGELMGQIEINKDPLDHLKETSTRGDGLIKNNAYDSLRSYFITVVERLEKYVVDVQRWGLSIEDEDGDILESDVAKLISNVTDDMNIISFQYPENIIDLLESAQSDSANKLVNNLNRLANSSGNDELINIAHSASLKLRAIDDARKEAERAAAEARKKAKETEQQVNDVSSENLFLKSLRSQEMDEVLSFMHHIGIYAGTIEGHLKNISLKLARKTQINANDFKETVRILSIETKKILNISAFATKANFKMSTEHLELDLFEYIREYLQNILPKTADKNLNISILTNDLKASFVKKIKPIELNIVIDNLIHNSQRAKAKNLWVRMNKVNDQFNLQFEDDGRGMDTNLLEKIFDFGFTTTNGSGLGLFHSKKIIEDMGGTIVASNGEQGAIIDIWVQ